MTSTNICNIEPFRYQSTPQPIGDQGASSNQINETFLEDYLNRMRQAVCDDIQNIIDNCCNGGGGGGGGAETFLQLTDTPSTYTGQAGNAAIVNPGETGLIFGTPAAGSDDDGLFLDMSTSEVATNRTYIDGKTIYQKTLQRAGNLPTGNTTIAHGITTLDRLVFLYCDVLGASGFRINLPYSSAALNFNASVQYADATNMLVQLGGGFTGASTLSNLNLTMWYTKV